MSDRARKILLAASLALNVFIVGAAVGGAYMWYSGAGPRIAAAKAGLRFAAEDLSQEQRRAFRQMLVQARRDARGDIEAARQGRGRLADLLAQDTLDRAAIDAALATVRGGDAALRGRLEQVVIDFASTLTPDERKRFVESLRGRGTLLRRVEAEKN